MAGSADTESLDREGLKLKRSTPLYVQIYDALRQQIIDGTLTPETPLSEKAVAERLSVSRTPAREALRLLESEGMLRAASNGRLFVYSLTVRDIAETYVVRAAIEPMAARLVCTAGVEQDVARLKDCVQQGRKAAASNDIDGVIASNAAFHHDLCALTQSNLVINAVQHFKARMARVRSVSLQMSSHREVSVQGHELILQAIETNDPDTAAELTERHILEAGKAMLLSLEVTSADRCYPSVKYLLEQA